MSVADAIGGHDDEWGTPQWLFDALDSIFHFTLDAAASDELAKCKLHLTAKDDALSWDSWGTEQSIFLNPPYSQLPTHAWVQKCAYEGQTNVIVGIFPAKIETAWFKETIRCAPFVGFFGKRIRFEHPIKEGSPTFGSVLPIWGSPDELQISKLLMSNLLGWALWKGRLI